MKSCFPILFASIAAIGNAMFALGQKKSGSSNGLFFVGSSAFIAFLLALSCAPLMGTLDIENTLRRNGKTVFLSGLGLFLTYLGFNLLYSKYGASQYTLYAVLSIITTTLIVGVLWLKEPVNGYHITAIVLAIASVLFFSMGQSKL